jgi:hypothetical protein
MPAEARYRRLSLTIPLLYPAEEQLWSRRRRRGKMSKIRVIVIVIVIRMQWARKLGQKKMRQPQ